MANYESASADRVTDSTLKASDRREPLIEYYLG